MVLRRIVALLVVAALVLPVAISILLGLGRLLAAMGDAAAALVVDRLALAGAVLWILALVSLLVAVALVALQGPEEPK